LALPQTTSDNVFYRRLEGTPNAEIRTVSKRPEINTHYRPKVRGLASYRSRRFAFKIRARGARP
jgi:hypothetical protein